MKYKSKIGWWFHLTVAFVLAMSAMPLVLFFLDYAIEALIVFGIILAVDALLVLPIYFCTNYTLEDTVLHIRSGLVISKRIAYEDITGIRETKNPLASAGLSLDRIAVNYTNGSVYISPKDKQEFVRQLNGRI